MNLVWSPDMASKAYIDTVKLCQNFQGNNGAELLSAMAAGWNSKLIVESWSYGGTMSTSVGLAVAASHTCGRHVCLVSDERSRSSYIEAMREAGFSPMNVVVGDEGESVAEISGVDFLVVDNSECKDIARVLRLSQKGAVLACKNACDRRNSEFRWNWVLDSRTRVVRSVFLPVEKGLDIAYVGANGGDEGSDEGPSRWIKHIDQRSGEEHIIRR